MVSTQRKVTMILRKAGIIAAASIAISLAFASPAFAQSGHFVHTPTCTDIGTQVQCTGKVAGLGGVTFEITVSAAGVAIVECTNHGGNVAPGQTFTTEVAGSTGPVPTPRNGHYDFDVTSVAPAAPVDSCPNPLWTPAVVDVEFTEATIALFEDAVESDSITVPVTL